MRDHWSRYILYVVLATIVAIGLSHARACGKRRDRERQQACRDAGGLVLPTSTGCGSPGEWTCAPRLQPPQPEKAPTP